MCLSKIFDYIQFFKKLKAFLLLLLLLLLLKETNNKEPTKKKTKVIFFKSKLSGLVNKLRLNAYLI